MFLTKEEPFCLPCFGSCHLMSDCASRVWSMKALSVSCVDYQYDLLRLVGSMGPVGAGAKLTGRPGSFKRFDAGRG